MKSRVDYLRNCFTQFYLSAWIFVFPRRAKKKRSLPVNSIIIYKAEKPYLDIKNVSVYLQEKKYRQNKSFQALQKDKNWNINYRLRAIIMVY